MPEVGSKTSPKRDEERTSEVILEGVFIEDRLDHELGIMPWYRPVCGV